MPIVGQGKYTEALSCASRRVPHHHYNNQNYHWNGAF